MNWFWLPFFWLGLFSRAPSAARALRAADSADCARLHAQSFAHAWSAHEFESLLSDPACSGEAAEGMFGVEGFVLSRVALDEAEVLTIMVEHSARKKGCAQRLLAAHLARLAGRGVRALFLEVDETNVAALALYRRNGFVQVGLRKGYYVKSDGTRANALAMRKDLA